MDFMTDVIDCCMDIWADCANCALITRMGAGDLDKDQFQRYILQDSLYLRDYLKTFAYAIVKSDTLREMQLYYELLGYVNDGENVTRLNYLKDMGMTDAQVDRSPKRPQCQAYCDFLIDTSRDGAQEDILMAMLPCMLGYGYVFEQLLARCPQVMDGYFGPLVADYTSEGYRACCEQWTRIANERCEALPAPRRVQLKAIFRQASLHELYFWRMAGDEA